VTLDNTPHTVLGVLPGHVGVGVIPRLYNDVFLPIGQNNDVLFLSRHVHNAAAIGRLRPDVALDEARAETVAIASALESAYPDANKGVGVNLVPVREDLVGDVRPTLVLLLGAVSFVMLIACANVSNLMLARFTGRNHEFAVRAALGASRMRILRQTATESLCLAFAGGAIGIVLAAWGTRGALRVIPSALPDIVNVGVNARVLLVAAAAALVSGLACASIPAIRVTRSTLVARLEQSGSRSSVRSHRAQHAFLATQLALTMMLLVGAGLMTRSLAHAWRVDPGFDPRGVVTFMTGLAADRGADPARVRLTIREIAERLAAVAGVEGASAVFGALPYTVNNNAVDFWRHEEPKPVGSDAPLTLYSAVGPEYFRVMRIPLLKGREFGPHDTSESPRVAIIDEAFAASVFPGQDPIGERVHLDGTHDPLEIIGVVGHVKHWGLDVSVTDRAQHHVYVPDAQLPDDLTPLAAKTFSVIVRSSRSTGEVLGSLRAALREYDNGQVMIGETHMEDGIARSLSGRRFSLLLIGTFAFLALVLSAVGVSGIASYLATERAREIGVRIALGARHGDVVRALLGSIGRAAVTGVALGVLASLGLARLIEGMLFNVSPADPATLIVGVVLLACVTLVASYLPARRMLRVDPLANLRHE
jgi:predicted permease